MAMMWYLVDKLNYALDDDEKKKCGRQQTIVGLINEK